MLAAPRTVVTTRTITEKYFTDEGACTWQAPASLHFCLGETPQDTCLGSSPRMDTAHRMRLYERGRQKVTAQGRPTSETGRNMTRTSTSTFAFHTGRDASSQMKYNVMPNSNCAAPKYSTQGRNMTRGSTWLFAFLTGRDASRQMS